MDNDVGLLVRSKEDARYSQLHGARRLQRALSRVKGDPRDYADCNLEMIGRETIRQYGSQGRPLANGTELVVRGCSSDLNAVAT